MANSKKSSSTYIGMNKFWLGCVIIVLLVLAPKLHLLIFGHQAKGKVVDFQVETTFFDQHLIPVIQFKTPEEKIQFKVKSGINYQLNETLNIIYYPKNPHDAKVYSFLGVFLDAVIGIPIYLVIWYFMFTSLPFLFANKKENEDAHYSPKQIQHYKQMIRFLPGLRPKNTYSGLTPAQKKVFKMLWIIVIIVMLAGLYFTIRNIGSWEVGREVFSIIFVLFGGIVYLAVMELIKI
ncbi:MAG: hypothetical protein ACOC3T_00970 [Bacteroidota bacterium]